MKAYLMLEDGSVYEGTARGDFRETACEIVFNTSMAGYVEILTDPCYAGQGVVMSYPIIGGYGVNREDFESKKVWADLLIVHELCDTPSNFRCEMTLEALLKEFHIPCFEGVDTRALVRKLRDNGTMRGVVTTDISDKDRLLKVMQECTTKRVVGETGVAEKTIIGDGDKKLAVLDFGVKNSVVDWFTQNGYSVILYPQNTEVSAILNENPDGVLISEGPGNPEDYESRLPQIKTLVDAAVPVLGIGLGHQLVALAQGGKTQKMKYGHHGTNHPVQVLSKDKTYLTPQNHGYEVAAEPMPEGAELSCQNTADACVEGLLYADKNTMTLQFCPQANHGPHDTSFMYEEFIKMMGKENDNA